VLKEHYDFQAVFLAIAMPCYVYIFYYALKGHRAGQPETSKSGSALQNA
jgi:fucose permease